MRAEDTRRGGRHIARERGSEEPDAEPEDAINWRCEVRGPMIERLSPASLMAVSQVTGLSVERLLERALIV